MFGIATQPRPQRRNELIERENLLIGQLSCQRMRETNQSNWKNEFKFIGAVRSYVFVSEKFEWNIYQISRRLVSSRLQLILRESAARRVQKSNYKWGEKWKRRNYIFKIVHSSVIIIYVDCSELTCCVRESQRVVRRQIEELQFKKNIKYFSLELAAESSS